MDRDRPVSRDVYDDLATSYESITGSAYREQYEWPAVESLLPPLDGVRVLDAACGDGFYTERLVDRGATAVGVDASPAMVARARERFAGDDRVEVRAGDLTDGFPEFDEAAFRLVVCQLALEHVADWRAVFEGFALVLEPGGRVVVSTSHPVRDYVDAAPSGREQVLADDATYGEVERADREWGDADESVVVPFYRRPLQAVFEPATAAGLLCERVVEPDVTDAFREAAPEATREFAAGPPNFLCLRFLKAAEGGG